VNNSNLSFWESELAVNELRKSVLKKIPFIGDKAQELIDAVATLKTDRKLVLRCFKWVNQIPVLLQVGMRLQ